MPDLVAAWKQLVVDLERERDELRMEAQLARAEARDCLHETERKLEDLRQLGHALKGIAKDAAGDVEVAGKALAAEICAGFARVRQLLDGTQPKNSATNGGWGMSEDRTELRDRRFWMTWSMRILVTTLAALAGGPASG